MADLHIEEFCKDCSAILVALYECFPRRESIFVEDISGEDRPDEYGIHSKRHIACFSTMLWLAEEGYLRYEDTIRQEAIDQAVLTHQALDLLVSPYPYPQEPGERGDERAAGGEQLPDSLKLEFSSNIYVIREALESRSSSRVYRVVSRILFPGSRSIQTLS